MRPRWEMWMFALALTAPACSMEQRQEVTVVIRQEEPLHGYAMGSISLGEGPGDLTAAQINASLAGYGTWADSAQYGRIWRPDRGIVGAAFVPYGTAGQWMPTDVGWYWQSDYAWGRVPFHYGRWVLDGAVWSWVPGAQFAPAWVDWRAGSGWVGWAALAPVGARSWAPFVYCAHGRLAGTGLDARLVRDAAASSLYARTVAVVADGEVPRGPAAQGVVTVAELWRQPVPVQAVALAAAVDGVDRLERIPVALVRELPPVVEAPVGGVALVIRDRDLVGMSEGPSVRRPAGASETLPDPVNPARAQGPVVVPPAAWTRVAPPALPPAPDGSWVGAFPSVYPGAYPGRPPLAFAQRRAAPAAPSYGAAAVVFAPSSRPAAAPPQAVSVMSAGGWSGPRGFASPAPGPLSTVR